MVKKQQKLHKTLKEPYKWTLNFSM
jgi:hypothetical protein